jgi:hypothetical protein
MIFRAVHHWDHTFAVELFRDRDNMRPLFSGGCSELIPAVITTALNVGQE